VISASARRISILIAALATAAVLVPAVGASSGGSAVPVLPTLYVVYTMNCTFSIVNDSGQPVSSIAPGTYQVEVSTPIMFKLVVPGGPDGSPQPASDFTGCKGWVQFQLTGPGVNLNTTLDSGCDAFQTLPAQTFKPSSTYTFQDNNQPAVTRTAITTLATGTPPTPKSPYGTTSGKGETSQDIVGSALKTSTVLRGTLNGSLNAQGKVALTSKGKPVSIVTAGRYRFTVTDQSANAGFVVKPVTGTALDVTATSFTGKHSRFVTLKPGRWMYYATPTKANYFLVVS